MAWGEWEASVQLPIIPQYLVKDVLWGGNVSVQVQGWVYSLFLGITWKQIPNNHCLVHRRHKEAVCKWHSTALCSMHGSVPKFIKKMFVLLAACARLCASPACMWWKSCGTDHPSHGGQTAARTAWTVLRTPNPRGIHKLHQTEQICGNALVWHWQRGWWAHGCVSRDGRLGLEAWPPTWLCWDGCWNICLTTCRAEIRDSVQEMAQTLTAEYKVAYCAHPEELKLLPYWKGKWLYILSKRENSRHFNHRRHSKRQKQKKNRQENPPKPQ